MNRSSSRRIAYAAVRGVAFWGAVLLAPQDAGAADEQLNLHLRYRAPQGCPSREELIEQLRARVDAKWLEGSDTRTFDVRVTRLPSGGFLGRLGITQEGRQPKVREIRSESCPAVTTSLAIFIAIALDSAAETPTEVPPPSDQAAAPNEADRSANDADARATDVRTPPVEQAPPPPAPAVTAPHPSAIWIWSAGYDVEYLRAPEPSWGGRVHAELTRTRDGALIAPTLRLSWGWVDFSTFPEGAGEARFRLKSARAEGCMHVRLTPFLAAACAGIDLGTITARTPDLARSQQATTQWTAPVALLRGTWLLTSWLALELQGGVLVPSLRTTFALTAPVRLVYQAPAVLFEGSLGLGAVAYFR